MLWIIFAMMLTTGFMGFLSASSLVGAVMQILLIGALVALGFKRIGAVSSRIQRHQLG